MTAPAVPPARVVICNDSAAIRGAIARILESDPGIQVVGMAGNGRMAIDAVKQTKVDVLVLDIDMPVMDGMTALPLLLEASPGLRIIIASNLTTRGGDLALRALRLGAADYVPNPSSIGTAQDETFRREMIGKVMGLVSRHPAPDLIPPLRRAPLQAPRLLAIGSSTGGPQALFTLFQGLGRSLNVPVILTQHMPAAFTPILASHIDRLGLLPCAEAKEGEMLCPDRIYLAPGDRHLLIEKHGTGLRARLTADPPENYCRPAVDPMLRAASEACGGRVLVAMLTGMGQDGLAGTTGIVASGGTAVAQDEATSVVWGMPGAIARAGLCHAVLPLPLMASKLRDLLRVPVR